VIGYTPLNQNVYNLVVPYVKETMSKLPQVTQTQREILEAARDRYDVLVGIVTDNNAVGVSETTKHADSKKYPHIIELYNGEPVVDDEKKLEMIKDITGISDTLCRVFLLEELIEELMCGVIPMITGDLTQVPYDQAVAKICEAIDGESEAVRKAIGN
jgi:hypothetical protein